MLMNGMRRIIGRRGLLFLLFLCIQHVDSILMTRQVHKLTGPDGMAFAGDEMGDENQVAVYDTIMAVGAFGSINGTGVVCLFDQNQPAMTQPPQQQPSSSEEEEDSTDTTTESLAWLQAQQVLLAQGGNVGDRFGYSVAMTGICTNDEDERRNIILVVGAPLDSVNGHYSGSVYVFRKDTIHRENRQESDSYFTQIAKLVPNDGSDDHRFGVAVDVDYDEDTDTTTIVVGAIYTSDKGPDSGSAYVFQDETENGTFTQISKLLASDGRSSARYGWSVAIDKMNVVVGTLNARTVYVYQKDPNRSTSFTEMARLTASDANARRNAFGSSVDTSENTIVIGAYLDDNTNGIKAGAVYVFRSQNDSTHHNNTTWYESAKLLTSDGFINHRFGIAVAIDRDIIVVGCTEDNGSTGSVYLFRRDFHGDSQFTEIDKITASDGSEEDFFGASVAIHDSTIVVGAYGDDVHGAWSGSAYEFQLQEARSLSAPRSCPKPTIPTPGKDTETLPVPEENGNSDQHLTAKVTTQQVEDEL